MYIAVLVRRLREGKTYEDFVEAWYPDKGFDIGGRGPITARSEQLDEYDFSTDETVERGRR
jgi:hypothetical protein